MELRVVVFAKKIESAKLNHGFHDLDRQKTTSPTGAVWANRWKPNKRGNLAVSCLNRSCLLSIS